MSLHRARNIAVHLAVVWQSVKLKSANFLKFCNRIFCFFGAPCRKAADYANLLRVSFFCLFALPSFVAALCFSFLCHPPQTVKPTLAYNLNLVQTLYI